MNDSINEPLLQHPAFGAKLRAGTAKSLFLSALAIAALASCAKGGGGSDGGGGTTTGGGNAPVLDTPTLTSNGCLDVGAAFAQLNASPEDVMVRRQTREFSIEKENHLGKEVKKNPTAAVAAYSRFKFVEKPLSLYMMDELTVGQTACDSVSFTRQIPGVESAPDVFTVQLKDKDGAPYPADSLHAVSADGQEERIYTLKGPREIELKTISPYMDPCPPYGIAKATTVDTITWGADVELAPVAVSRQLIDYLDIAVLTTPPGLIALMSVEPEAQGGIVQAAAADIKSLLPLTQKDPNVHTCEHKPKPPSGDEPGIDDPD